MYVPVRNEFIWPNEEYVELCQKYDEPLGIYEEGKFYLLV